MPVIITVIGVLILYPFLSQSFLSILQAVKMSISIRSLVLPAGVNLKYLILFSGLILMSFTDMLFERIAFIIPVFLIIAGLIFAFLAKIPLLTPLEALGAGIGIFIFMDITELGSYAMGDIIAAGAIGTFVGIKEIVIISIFAIILGKIIFYIGVKLDGVCDKSSVKQFHFAFVPVLFLAAAVIYNFKI
jgi:hypothetical protein